MIKETLAVGEYSSGLYKLTKESFSCKLMNKTNSRRDATEEYLNVNRNIMLANQRLDIWHLRLGHVSDEVLSHVHNIKLENASSYYKIFPGAKHHMFPF